MKTKARSKRRKAIRRLALVIAVAVGLAVGLLGESLDARQAHDESVSPEVVAQRHLVLGVRNTTELFPPFR